MIQNTEDPFFLKPFVSSRSVPLDVSSTTYLLTVEDVLTEEGFKDLDEEFVIHDRRYLRCTECVPE